jgi:uncharacterized membrane protein YvbJ
VSKEKRPPINISELESKKEEREPGSITYVRSDRQVGREVREESSRGEKVLKSTVVRRSLFGIDIKALIVILVSVILTIVIVTSYAPSKSSVTDEVSRFETAVAEEVKKIQASSSGTEQQRIENLIQTIDRLTERIDILEGR